MEKNSWPFVARTWLTDILSLTQVRQGADLVINLAAGLDARLTQWSARALYNGLKWICRKYSRTKEEILRNEKPVCVLSGFGWICRMRALAASCSQSWAAGQTGVVVAEGLLVYLTEDEVRRLAKSRPPQRPFTLDH